MNTIFHTTREENSMKISVVDFLVRTRHIYAFLIFSFCIYLIVSTSSFYEKDIHHFGHGNKAEVISNAIRIKAEEDKRGAYETPEILNDSSKNYFWVPCHRDFEAEKWTNWTREPQLRCGTVSKPGIYSSMKSDGLAAQYEAALKLLVENFKPDIIFIVFITQKTVLLEGAEMQAPVVDWKTDHMLQHMQKNFDFYSNYTSRIVVDLPYYYNNDLRYAQEINKRLEFGKSLEDLKSTRQEVYDQQHWQNERLKRVNCSKCIFNDIGESLFEGDIFYWYDRKTYLALVADGVHLSQAGLKRARKQYEPIVEKVIEELN